MKNNRLYRPVTFLDFHDLETEVLRPESVMIVYSESKDSAGSRTADLGCFCYQSRDAVSGKKQVGTAVDPATLDTKRAPVTRGLVNYLRAGGTGSVERKYNEVKKFFNWVDRQDRHFDFDDIDQMTDAYCEYSAYLNHLSNLSQVGKGLSKTTAEGYQKAAAIVVSLALGLTLDKVQTFTAMIRRSRGRIARPGDIGSQDERSRTFSALVNFIGEVHRVVVLGEDLPLRFCSPNDEDFFFYVAGQVGLKSNNPESILFHLKQYRQFPKLSVIYGRSGISKESAENNKVFNEYSNCRVTIKNFKSNPKGYAAKVLVQRALSAGLITFISASGTNLSVVQALEVHTGRVVPSTKGKRYSGTKGRADGKYVYPEFGLDYVPVFKKIMDLRKWLLNGRATHLVFPYETENGMVGSVESACIGALKSFFEVVLPNTVWVTPRQWRKGVGTEYIKLSDGDTVLTSEKLGNTESVVRIHYSRPSMEDTAVELTAFFDLVYSTAIARTRLLPEIPVTVIDDSEHPSNIPTGRCDKPDELRPALADGFTSFAPVPSCGEPTTCLFCIYFGVHADEQDVRRLISLEYLLKVSRGSMANERYIEKYSPMLHRIDEVLGEICKVSGPTLIAAIRAEVQGGKLDRFWEIHFNTFVSLGVVS